MSAIYEESGTTASLTSSFVVLDTQEEILAQAQCLENLQLVGAIEWKRLLQEKGLLTDDEKELIDCLLEAVSQVSLV
jgi:hypothetical protein